MKISIKEGPVKETGNAKKRKKKPLDQPNWTEITLTTCGTSAESGPRTGKIGPTREECLAWYTQYDRNDPSFWQNKRFFDVDPYQLGIQKIRIPSNGVYEICAWGAGNKNKHGSGAIIKTKVELNKNEILFVAVGQQASYPSCGNGGTFVVRRLNGRANGKLKQILVAGGAGGNKNGIKHDCCDASVDEHGNGPPYYGRNYDLGSGGGCNDMFKQNGGAGFNKGPPIDKLNRKLKRKHVFPKCFADGMNGAGSGGFGGGGCAGLESNGGGGGYTGGTGSKKYETPGGGGGSFSIDHNRTGTLGWYNAGKCTIKLIEEI